MEETQTELKALEERSARLFGPLGMAMHGSYLRFFAMQQGTGALFEQYESETGSRDDLPNPDKLERDLGRLADHIRYVKPADVDRMKQGDSNPPSPPLEQPQPDLSRPGSIGWPESRYEFDRNRDLHLYDDRTWARGGYKDIQCGEFWGMYVNLHDAVQSCDGINFEAIYRETVLRGLAEAHRVCARTRCEHALAWILVSAWGCSNYGSPNTWCTIRFAVTCTAI